MAILIILDLSVVGDTVTAFAAEMLRPFTAFMTDPVCTSEGFGHRCTAILAQLTVRTDILAILAHAAFSAYRRAVRAYLLTIAAKL